MKTKPLNMVSILATFASTLLVLRVSGQGIPFATFTFCNNGGQGGPRAPVYGSDTNNPYLQLWGNAPNASPPGTQIYTGLPLSGNGYSVEAWYSTNPVSDVFQLLTDGRPAEYGMSSFNQLGNGYFTDNGPVIYDAVPTPYMFTNSAFYNSYVYLQVRAWDNAGGQFATWDAAWSAAQAGDGRAVGWSKVFWQPTAMSLITCPQSCPPGIYNFESFNLFLVPEPSSLSLGLVSAICVLLSNRFRRARRRTRPM